MTMTPEEFYEAMKEIDGNYRYDEEMAHIKADDLMNQVLSDLGYDKGIAVFTQMSKWYAWKENG